MLEEERMISDEEADKLRVLIKSSDMSVVEIFREYEETEDYERLALSLISIVRQAAQVFQTANRIFQEALVRLVEDASIDLKDAAWLRGRRAAEDEWLCDHIGGAEDIVASDLEDLYARLRSASAHFRSKRAEYGVNLDQLVKNMAPVLEPAQMAMLQALVAADNELVLSAYEVFAVDLHDKELYETLMMALQQPAEESEDSEDNDVGDDDKEDGDNINVDGIKSALDDMVDDGDLSPVVAARLFEMVKGGHQNILAAFDVYAETQDVTDLLDTIQNIIELDDWVHEDDPSMFQTFRELSISLVQKDLLTQQQARHIIEAVCSNQNDALTGAWSEFMTTKDIDRLEASILEEGHLFAAADDAEIVDEEEGDEDEDEDEDEEVDAEDGNEHVTAADVDQILDATMMGAAHAQLRYGIFEEPGTHYHDVLVAAILCYRETGDVEYLKDTLDRLVAVAQDKYRR